MRDTQSLEDVHSGDPDRIGPEGRDRPRIAFHSILFEKDPGDLGSQEAPEYFPDLNLDQIVEGITAGKQDYNLKPFFFDSLKTVDAVLYRHEVMRDLESGRLLECVRSFASDMRLMRRKSDQADKLYYKQQKERWFVHAVEVYCAAVRRLQEGLSQLQVSSRGVRALRDYVTQYAESNRFAALAAATAKLTRDLAAVRYCILIKGNGFKVRKYDAELDYSAEVTETFQKFQQGAAKDYRVEFTESVGMDHIEAKVLEFVALLYPEVFSELAAFFTENQHYADPVLMNFDREVQFYVSYIEYVSQIKRAGLGFCYPRMSASDKQIHDAEAFDLALAAKLVADRKPVVCNDVALRGIERVLVVSGPNQGGKTTLARTFGQLHHIASIGLPVPGRNAQLFLYDSMYTHFEKEENIKNLHGKLQDDLIRLHAILQRATPRSIIIMNEIFTSTTLNDAVFLGRKVIGRILDLDALCVCVTFLDELASLSGKTVSMVSTVMPDNPAMRTYKVVRRPADGRSYAISIAQKYRLTYECLKTRIRS
jgi:hypothetical protein